MIQLSSARWAALAVAAAFVMSSPVAEAGKSRPDRPSSSSSHSKPDGLLASMLKGKGNKGHGKGHKPPKCRRH